jgi:uncharacterized protein (DUF362 family)
MFFIFNNFQQFNLANMKRRDFILKSAVASVASGALFSMGKWEGLLASEINSSLPYDMIAIKNGDPVTMFKMAMEALGGMKKFVKPNQIVVVKPNIGWDAPPERSANTNPELVGQVVRSCIEAGAKQVMVFDNPCDEWTRCYKNSGIEQAVKDSGGQIVSGKNNKDYIEVAIPKGVVLKNAKVHKLFIESDVIINVPVLKNHGGAVMSLAMKNLMGVVLDRGFYHRNDLQQCIADFVTYRKPDLNIVDGFRVMKRNGPKGVSVNDVVDMKYQIIGKDIVAIDTAATKVFGLEIDKVQHILLAEKLGLGTTNLDSLNIKRITV